MYLYFAQIGNIPLIEVLHLPFYFFPAVPFWLLGGKGNIQYFGTEQDYSFPFFPKCRMGFQSPGMESLAQFKLPSEMTWSSHFGFSLLMWATGAKFIPPFLICSFMKLQTEEKTLFTGHNSRRQQRSVYLSRTLCMDVAHLPKRLGIPGLEPIKLKLAKLQLALLLLP